MASHIIGISGRKRSGKDTFAARLVSHHGFTRVAFADPLKAVLKDLDPMVGANATTGGDYGYGGEWFPSAGEPEPIHLSEVLGRDNDWETAKELPEVRRLLQVLGVAVREHVGGVAWVNAALKTCAGIPGPVVITDCRFPNEAEVVRRCRGSIVRVNRPGLPDTDLHISETALDALVADFPVLNDGTIADLNDRADEVAASVLAS